MVLLKSNEEKRKENNSLALKKLQLALTDYPNLALNLYILAFAKSFMENGKLDFKENKNRAIDFNLHLYDANFNGNITIINKPNDKHTIHVSLAFSQSFTKADSYRYLMDKIFTFDNEIITMQEHFEYEHFQLSSYDFCIHMDSSISDVRNAFYVFKNNYQINESGDYTLIYGASNSNTQEKKKTKNSIVNGTTEILRIDENQNAVIEQNAFYEIYRKHQLISEKEETKGFKAINNCVTFEDVLNAEPNLLEELVEKQEEISSECLDNFTKAWKKEQFDLKGKCTAPFLQNIKKLLYL